MEAQMEAAMHYWPLIGLIVLVVTFKLWLRLFGVIIIPQNTMGLVNKRFVILGSNRTLPDGAIIALKGEAGYQSDTLAPGLHIGLWPWQYEIDTVKFTTIQEGCLGVVESRDGIPLSGGRVLAKHVDCDSFQNARQFWKMAVSAARRFPSFRQALTASTLSFFRLWKKKRSKCLTTKSV